MLMVNKYSFTVRRLSFEEGGGYLAIVKDLPGCYADGETPEIAMRNIKDAINSWVKTAKLLGVARVFNKKL